MKSLRLLMSHNEDDRCSEHRRTLANQRSLRFNCHRPIWWSTSEWLQVNKWAFEGEMLYELLNQRAKFQYYVETSSSFNFLRPISLIYDPKIIQHIPNCSIPCHDCYASTRNNASLMSLEEHLLAVIINKRLSQFITSGWRILFNKTTHGQMPMYWMIM